MGEWKRARRRDSRGLFRALLLRCCRQPPAASACSSSTSSLRPPLLLPASFRPSVLLPLDTKTGGSLAVARLQCLLSSRSSSNRCLREARVGMFVCTGYAKTRTDKYRNIRRLPSTPTRGYAKFLFDRCKFRYRRQNPRRSTPTEIGKSQDCPGYRQVPRRPSKSLDSTSSTMEREPLLPLPPSSESLRTSSSSTTPDA